MALVGLPTVAALTTREMTPDQYTTFRRHWILANRDTMMWEGDVSIEIATLTAKNDFTLEEKKDSPFAARDQTVRRNRRNRRRRSLL